MTDLSSSIPSLPNDWPHDLTDAELAAVDTDGHVTNRQHNPGECKECMEVYRIARRMIAAAAPLIAAEERERLAAAGRLLPEGAEHRTQLLIRWTWPDGHSSDWGPDSLEQVPDLLAEPPEHEGIPAETYEVMFREHWASEWAPIPAQLLADI
jgi:hypothetical protein